MELLVQRSDWVVHALELDQDRVVGVHYTEYVHEASPRVGQLIDCADYNEVADPIANFDKAGVGTGCLFDFNGDAQGRSRQREAFGLVLKVLDGCGERCV
jgi:hypothetical protein